ncbi:hypothetical protein KP79_PYT05935 [Mizuhopecten yessoensis]|uniref:Uncharacterized protein n=1 Tax=Mizuhopecten yessoensis TaxID=6573 RepID=A0A210QA77_MIZYE|nr:hypothetical protein KP79_PYT05935 [Mizuhopecten yessoensis]
MATCAVVGVGVISLVLLVIHVVAVATPGWALIEIEGEGSCYIGLFQICIGSKCFSYEEGGEGVSLSHIAYVGLHVVGAILLLANGINSLRYFRPLPDGQARSIATKVAIVLSAASGCILVGVVWFSLHIANIKDLLPHGTPLSQELQFGYSFYLAAGTGASSVIFAITMGYVATQLEASPVITTCVTPPCPRMVVVHSTTLNQTGSSYPMTSPAGFPQNDPANGYDQ